MNMKIGYNFGIFVYKQLVSLASLKNKKAKKMIQGHKEIFRYLSENADPQGMVIYGYMLHLWVNLSRDVLLSSL